MIKERQRNFFALLLLFEFGLIGVFSALDLFAFYVFWEVALVPMYLMVGGWGGARRGPSGSQVFRLHNAWLSPDARIYPFPSQPDRHFRLRRDPERIRIRAGDSIAEPSSF